MAKGVVKWFDDKKGYGFIESGISVRSSDNHLPLTDNNPIKSNYDQLSLVVSFIFCSLAP
jgi:hypothetical protein